MRVRRRYLPPGWYPGAEEKAREAIENMERSIKPEPARGIAGIVPHAGWEFSGGLAFEVLSRISRTMDTIVIIGGHLGPADGILCAFEDSYETPFGLVPADLELLAAIRAAVPVTEDRSADNTVEVQLPFVKYLFPLAKVLGMRASPSLEADRLGKALAEAARGLGRKVGVAGSTDLTHYGSSYGFAPAGSGNRALRWVKEVNDHRIIESLLAMEFDTALERALSERSACSAGGALAALSFARENGVREGKLLRYSTSFDVHPGDSFVGYAGILYS
ncbi:MAG: AmmeMemoRadiSam system protein B [Spirochaetia bacterium]|jgi:AmmeMemoRadiSam system protein B